MKFSIGQIWVRDGCKRELVRIYPVKVGGRGRMRVAWRYPGRNWTERMCWYSTWVRWTDGARLLKTEDLIVDSVPLM